MSSPSEMIGPSDMNGPNEKRPARLVLGPVLFHWDADRLRDFYHRIADEAPVDSVHLGEVVCAKRLPFFADHLDAVADRLRRAGKEVVLSTLALVMNAQERAVVREAAARDNTLVEANDASALAALRGRPHAVGPFVNVYNERALAFLARHSARRVCFSPELGRDALAVLAPEARAHGMEPEVLVYGRMPLALSARCYHARAEGLAKDGCRFVCGQDPDGRALTTMDGTPFLSVNGIQTLSHACLNLLDELAELRALSIDRFRLSPQSVDMVAVARLYRAVLDGTMAPDEATARLGALDGLDAPFANGYMHGAAGALWTEADRAGLQAEGEGDPLCAEG